jgi:hypothetical protein
MPEQLNELLADAATALVSESFTGVNATWWWERRMGGGIEICQEFDPELAIREISAKTGQDVCRVRLALARELGLDSAEPVVLTFEVSGQADTGDAARMLAERSAKPEGLASGIYQRIEDAINTNP